MKKQAVVATLVATRDRRGRRRPRSATRRTASRPANGNDYILPDGSVYQQNDDGTFSWIPNSRDRRTPWASTGTTFSRSTELDGAVGRAVPVRPRPVERLVQPDGGTSSGAAGAVKVTPANGWDYVLDNGQVWQDNQDGTCSWIPDVGDRKRDAPGLERPDPVGRHASVRPRVSRSRTSTDRPERSRPELPSRVALIERPPGRQSADQYSGCAGRDERVDRVPEVARDRLRVVGRVAELLGDVGHPLHPVAVGLRLGLRIADGEAVRERARRRPRQVDRLVGEREDRDRVARVARSSRPASSAPRFRAVPEVAGHDLASPARVRSRRACARDAGEHSPRGARCTSSASTAADANCWSGPQMPLESSATAESERSWPVAPFHCVATKPDSPLRIAACLRDDRRPVAVAFAAHRDRSAAMCDAIRLASTSSGLWWVASAQGSGDDGADPRVSPRATAVGERTNARTTAAVTAPRRTAGGAQPNPSRPSSHLLTVGRSERPGAARCASPALALRNRGDEPRETRSPRCSKLSYWS